jgi:hypothetical protein
MKAKLRIGNDRTGNSVTVDLRTREIEAQALGAVIQYLRMRWRGLLPEPPGSKEIACPGLIPRFLLRVMCHSHTFEIQTDHARLRRVAWDNPNPDVMFIDKAAHPKSG